MPAELFDPKKLEEKVDRWLRAGGVKALYQAHQRAEEIKKELRMLLTPDPDTLDKPMTI